MGDLNFPDLSLRFGFGNLPSSHIASGVPIIDPATLAKMYSQSLVYQNTENETIAVNVPDKIAA